MSTMTRDITPEAIWGDAVAKARGFATLSQRYATQGEPLPAVHAAWASDIAHVQAVMWERVMVASPAPDEQFESIAGAVGQALLRHSAVASEPCTTAAGCVAAARQGLAGAFDHAALTVLAERFSPLEHLAALPCPAAADIAASAYRRVGDSDAASLSAQRKQVAADSMLVALGMHREGRDDDAMNQAWASDWAAFEAYLLDAALAIADESLVTVDLRWALACDLIQAVPALPSGFADAVAVIRARLAEAAGPVEGARLGEYFAPLT